MLSIKGVTRKYKNGSTFKKAINDLTTIFSMGEFTFILGESGSGKSTLLNVLCGLDTEIDGAVEVDGVDTSNFTKKDWAIYRNRYVGFVFQEYNLIEHLKLWENVALPLQFQGVKKSEAKIKAITELENVGLGKFVDKMPNQISGGQAQRVAIARALVTDPKVIMADEPTGALDTELGEKIISYLKHVSQKRVVVVVTHDEDLAEKYAQRIIRLSDGKIIEDSSPNNVGSKNAKELSFNPPKMTLGMMLKFAKNNVLSRFTRSLATSTVVSIGYISIFLLTFLIFGINTTITDTIASFIPEDQYQIYPIENSEISTIKLQEIASFDEISEVRYNVTEMVSFKSRGNNTRTVNLSPIPYDMAVLTEDAELYGRIPTESNEIIISIGMAGSIRDINQVDEDSYEYIFNLINGSVIDLFTVEYIEWDNIVESDIGSYTVVGVIASPMNSFTSTAYLEYDEILQVSESINDEITYKGIATAYLSIDNDDEIDAFKIKLREDHDLVLDNLYTSITSGIEEFMFTALKIFIGVASITLIVSGILIALVIYTSILERIKEIGILTAIGARQGNIIGIFIMESAIIGLFSSIIAVVVSLLLTRIINGLFNSIIQKPLSILTSSDFNMTLLTPKLWIIAVVIGFSIFFSIISGLIPSFKASRLNAVKALRRE